MRARQLPGDKLGRDGRDGGYIKDTRWHEEISRLMNELIATKRDLQQKTMELQDALDKVKLLSGYLPICASCKKIRDDKGYWQEVESYIDSHSEAQFSHGICPECIQKLYPEIKDTK